MPLTFDLNAVCGDARAGVIHTDHGDIQTPIFMPVGTAGSVKAVHQQELKDEVKAQIILGNTYHLYLRPGCDILRQAGGLHRFNAWDRPLLTDSGGFQVFSLADNRKIKEEGCTFRSHIDGSKHLFTPENVMDIQRVIGADIMMAFDECAPGDSDHRYAQKSMELTHRWLDRCIARFSETEPEYIASKEPEGCAIGGLAVGEPTEKMYEMIEVVNAILPKNRPRYLMGVGTPQNLLEAIERGVDMFDCVMPTRNGRNGLLFTAEGTINIKNKKWETCFEPIYKGYTLAYLHHLIRAEEILGLQICSIVNLRFYLWLVGEARSHIVAGDYATWKAGMVGKLGRRL